MKKTKTDPRIAPPGDSQGHSYQHELGDPQKAQQIEAHLKKAERDAEARKPRSPKPARTSEARTSGRPVVWITGSGGLIGSKLVEAFATNYDIVGMDLTRPETVPAGTDFIKCDLTKDESVENAIRMIRERHGDKVATVIHLAAHYDFSGEPSPMYERLTVQGTSRLLTQLQSFKVEQFVFSSTILVMAPSEDEDQPIKETSPLEDEPWDYPRSKIVTEELIHRERGQIPTVILRIGGVYDEFVRTVPIAQQIARIYRKEFESHFFPGDADHGQAFVHIDDLVDCFRKVLERRSQLDPMEIFLVAEPDLMSYRDLQNEIGQLIHGEKWTTVWIPKLMAKAGAWMKGQVAEDKKTFIKPWMIDLADDHYPVSIKHAREKLGWEPQHHLRTTLPQMIRNLKRNPKRWFQINKIETERGDTKRSA